MRFPLATMSRCTKALARREFRSHLTPYTIEALNVPSLSNHRFLMEPRKDIRAQQTEEDKMLSEDLANLSKKVSDSSPSGIDKTSILMQLLSLCRPSFCRNK
jgi:hypothetical protein